MSWLVVSIKIKNSFDKKGASLRIQGIQPSTEKDITHSKGFIWEIDPEL